MSIAYTVATGTLEHCGCPVSSKHATAPTEYPTRIARAFKPFGGCVATRRAQLHSEDAQSQPSDYPADVTQGLKRHSRAHRSSSRRLWCFIVLCIVCFTFLVGDRAFAEAPPEQRPIPREALACGPTALLIYMTLSGKTVSDETIRGIPCPSDGVSLLALCQLANALGNHSEVRRFKLSEYSRMPVPAIIQLNTNRRLHYVVVYSSGPAGLYVMDDTEPAGFKLKQSSFEELFTGYAMVPSSSQRSVVVNRMLSGSAVSITALVVTLCCTLVVLFKLLMSFRTT